jgi:Spy/CpxP family protein refolding chaperone
MNNSRSNLSTRIRMIGLSLAGAGLIALSLPALAQPQYGKGGAERLAERLELTSEQREQIEVLFEAHRDQMREQRQQNREARLALREEISAILTEEQAEKFESMRKHHGDRGSRKGQRRYRGHRD